MPCHVHTFAQMTCVHQFGCAYRHAGSTQHVCVTGGIHAVGQQHTERERVHGYACRHRPCVPGCGGYGACVGPCMLLLPMGAHLNVCMCVHVQCIRVMALGDVVHACACANAMGHTHRQFVGRVWVHVGCEECGGCGSVLSLRALRSCNVPLHVYAYIHLWVLHVCCVGQRDARRGDVDGCLMCSGTCGGSQPWRMRHVLCPCTGMHRGVGQCA